MGRSLGAAAVIDLASREGARALVIQSSFTSAPDVLKHHAHGILHGPRMMTCFNSESKIGAYHGPVLISHSRGDKALPYSQGVRLAEAATSASHVVFMELEGGHRVPPGEDYFVVLCDFLTHSPIQIVNRSLNGLIWLQIPVAGSSGNLSC